jgi:hypothetical protein
MVLYGKRASTSEAVQKHDELVEATGLAVFIRLRLTQVDT